MDGDITQLPGVSDITPGQQEPPKPDAVQQRINELVAQNRESQRAMQAMQETMQNMMLCMTQPAAPANTQPQQTPAIPQIQLPEGTDPAIAQAFAAQNAAFQQMMAQQAQQMTQVVQQQVGRIEQNLGQYQFQQEASSVPQEVQQLANQLYADWQRRQLPGWTPKDAVDHAYGILARQGKTFGQQTQTQPRQLNQGGYTTPGGAGIPPTNVQNVLPERLPDMVLNKMSPDARYKYEAERLAKTGGLDQPIVY